MVSLAADTTDPARELELFVPRLLADITAYDSTLLPRGSSVATTRTLTNAISPYSPPVLFLVSADIATFFLAASANSPVRSEGKKSSVG